MYLLKFPLFVLSWGGGTRYNYREQGWEIFGEQGGGDEPNEKNPGKV